MVSTIVQQHQIQLINAGAVCYIAARKDKLQQHVACVVTQGACQCLTLTCPSCLYSGLKSWPQEDMQ